VRRFDFQVDDYCLVQFIIIFIIIIISIMQGIYTYIPETNNVPKQYNVAAILSLLFMVPISLVIDVIIIISCCINEMF
jgi:hypothetical protein